MKPTGMHEILMKYQANQKFSAIKKYIMECPVHSKIYLNMMK